MTLLAERASLCSGDKRQVGLSSTVNTKTLLVLRSCRKLIPRTQSGKTKRQAPSPLGLCVETAAPLGTCSNFHQPLLTFSSTPPTQKQQQDPLNGTSAPFIPSSFHSSTAARFGFHGQTKRDFIGWLAESLSRRDGHGFVFKVKPCFVKDDSLSIFNPAL